MPEDITVDGKSFNDMRVVDLKEQLDKRGLSKSGTKPILVQRLKEALELERMAGAGLAASAPNAELNVCGNEIVSEYLKQQQLALQAARKAAEEARAAAASSSEELPVPDTVVHAAPPRIDTSADATSLQEPEPSSLSLRKSPRTRSKDSSQEINPAVAVADLDEEAGKKKRQRRGSEGKDDGAVTVGAVPAYVPPGTTAITSVTATEEQPNLSSLPASTEERFSSSNQSSEQVQKEHEETEKMEDSTPEKTEEKEKRDDSYATTASAQVVETTETAADAIRNESCSHASEAEDARERIDFEEPDFTKEDDSKDVISENREEQEELIYDEPSVDDIKSEDVQQADTEKLDIEQHSADKPARKRKWGSNKPVHRAIAISTDSLKDIIGPVAAAVEAASKRKSRDQEVEHSQHVTEPENEVPYVSSAMLNGHGHDVAPKRIVVTKEETLDSISGEVEAKNSERIVREHNSTEANESVEKQEFKTTEYGLKRMRSPSPARKSTSNIIHVRGLTRPFTLKALYELLSKFGSYDKEKFWMDTKKSNCFVVYNNQEEATLARNELHGVEWPPANPRVLRVDFAEQSELDSVLIPAHKEEPQVEHPDEAKRMVVTLGEKEPRKISPSRVDARRRSRSPVDRRAQRSDSPSAQKKISSVMAATREWDRGKDWKVGGSPPRERRGRESPGLEKRKGATKDEPPAKLLDDLFRKTKVTPCIYWLPLTDEQIVQKQKERASAMQQRERQRQERVAAAHRRVSRSPDRERDRYRRR